MEKGCPDVIQMTEQWEQTSLQFVVPNLNRKIEESKEIQNVTGFHFTTIQIV
jgi:hypothetical protein